MGKIILISGPTKSGKTSLAEKMAKNSAHESISYLATQANIFTDEGMALRIEHHKKSRPEHWSTIEAYKDLSSIIENDLSQGMILDCVTVWATNLFFDELALYYYKKYSKELLPKQYDDFIDSFDRWDIDYFSYFLMDEMKKIVKTMQEIKKDYWLVSNELGWSVTPHTILGSIFVDYIGQLNNYLASQADEVYLTMMGLNQQLK